MDFIKPKKYEAATADDVREFLEMPSGEGKKEWQLRQAEEGVRVFFQEVEPQKWAGNWPTDLLANVKLGIDEQGAADVGRRPTQGAATLAYTGREDTGDLPERYAPFMEQTTEALRLERYSYRTEQSYLEWVRRFLIFTQPASRADIRWWQVKEYLEYLTLKRRVTSATLNQALSALQFCSVAC